jgi:hypothetical protein
MTQVTHFFVRYFCIDSSGIFFFSYWEHYQISAIKLIGKKSPVAKCRAVTLTFEIGTLGLHVTLHLIEVNILAKYKQDCSMHVISLIKHYNLLVNQAFLFL